MPQWRHSIVGRAGYDAIPLGDEFTLEARLPILFLMSGRPDSIGTGARPVGGTCWWHWWGLEGGEEDYVVLDFQ